MCSASGNTSCGNYFGSSGMWCLRMWGLIITYDWPSTTEVRGLHTLKLMWVRGFEPSSLKRHILKRHNLKHPTTAAGQRLDALSSSRRAECASQVLRVDLRETKGVPKKGVWTSVSMRVWTCKTLRVKCDQTRSYLRPPFLGTPSVPSRVVCKAVFQSVGRHEECRHFCRTDVSCVMS